MDRSNDPARSSPPTTFLPFVSVSESELESGEKAEGWDDEEGGKTVFDSVIDFRRTLGSGVTIAVGGFEGSSSVLRMGIES